MSSISSYKLDQQQINHFNTSIDAAKNNKQISGKSAHFAKEQIITHSQNFDLEKFQSWASREISKHDSSHPQAANTIIQISQQTLKSQPSSQSRSTPIDHFSDLLNQAVTQGQLSRKTARETLKIIQKYSQNLNTSKFFQWVDTQVTSHDPGAVSLIKGLFTQSFPALQAQLKSFPSSIKIQEYPSIKIDKDAHQYPVRNATFEAVKNSKLQDADITEDITLLELEEPLYDAQEQKALLPRFGALTVTNLPPIDYGASWGKDTMAYAHLFPDSASKKNNLSMTYIASINIGESKNSADAEDYKNQDGTLNEKKFLQDMSTVFKAGFLGQIQNGATQLVWNPVGMGAFLRQVHRNFKDIDQDKILCLRQKIAHTMIKTFNEVKQSDTILHLCLFTGDTEADNNYNAFAQAVEKEPLVHNNLIIHHNGDMLEITQHLANKYGPNKANVIIAANRQLLGNHWFGDYALRASDENIHRRWVRASLIAKRLNNGFEVKTRKPNELKETIQSIKSAHVRPLAPPPEILPVEEPQNQASETSIMQALYDILLFILSFLSSLIAKKK